MVLRPVIYPDKCNGCGLCVSVCSCNTLILVNNVITIVQTEGCHWCTKWCNNCEEVCLTGAIVCPFEIVIEDSAE